MHIFVPKLRVAEVYHEAKVGVKGFIGWELIDRCGRVVRSSPLQPNMIVDAGLDYILGTGGHLANGLLLYCGVGSSNTPPDPSHTSLISQVGTRVNSNGGTGDVEENGPAEGTDPGPSYRRFRRVRLFDFNNANGNLTEVGFFTAAVGGTMFNRQLLVDEQGQPATITKTSSYQLRVIVEVRQYHDFSDSVAAGVILSGGATATEFEFQTRLLSVPNQTLWINPDYNNFYALAAQDMPPYGTPPSGTTYRASSGGYAAYVPGSFYRDYTATWNAVSGNVPGGIGLVRWAVTHLSGDMWATRITPSVPKLDTQQFKLFVRISVARRP
jgi:hypothetical protein